MNTKEMLNNEGRFSGLIVKESLWPRNSWKLGRVIGSGACSEVYEATCQLTSKGNGSKNLSSDKATSFVAKVSPLPEQKVVVSKKPRKKYTDKASADVLHMEHSFYRNRLAGHPRVPRMPTDGGYGDDLKIGVRFMVLERLSSTLESFANKAGGLTPKEVTTYGKQILDALKTLHEDCGLLFVDVKPANFMFGAADGPQSQKLYLVDFGLSRTYIGRGGEHRPFSQGMVEGTPKYMSISCHKGGSPGRRDDLEALGYVFLDLIGCNLPWSYSKNDKDCLTCKSSVNLETLCVDMPSIAKFISLARKTPYDAEPDYKAFEYLLEDLSSKDVALTKRKPTQQHGGTKLSSKRGSVDASMLPPIPSSRRKLKAPLELKSGEEVVKSSNPKRRHSSRGTLETANQCVAEIVKRSDPSVSTPSKVRGGVMSASSSSLLLPFILVCTRGPCEGTTYDMSVRKGGLIIGSGVKSQIRIVGDSSVSDALVKLSYIVGKPNMLLVHRLDDDGDLFVNMMRLPKASSRVRRYLKDKDVLTIGNTQLVLRCNKPSN